MTDMIMVAADGVWHGLSAEMFSGVFDDLYAALPIIVPACIALLGFRKAWRFVIGMIKGA